MQISLKPDDVHIRRKKVLSRALRLAQPSKREDRTSTREKNIKE